MGMKPSGPQDCTTMLERDHLARQRTRCVHPRADKPVNTSGLRSTQDGVDRFVDEEKMAVRVNPLQTILGGVNHCLLLRLDLNGIELDLREQGRQGFELQA